MLGCERTSGGDEVFRQVILARIIEPASKPGALRALGAAVLAPVSHATLKRRPPVYAKEPWRQRLTAAAATHTGPGPACPAR